MRIVTVFLVLAATVAHAEDRDVDLLLLSARELATQGRCDRIAEIGEQVRALDATYHRQVFVTDPAFARCMPGSQREPSAKPGLPPADPLPSEARPASSDETRGLAVSLSIGGTVGGALLFVAGASTENALGLLAGTIGLLVGPSVGHIYAGSRVINPGSVTRVLGGVIGFIGLAVAFGCGLGGGCSGGSEDLGVVAFVGGGMTFLVGTIYDVGTAGREPRRKVALVPAAGGAPGVSVVSRF